MRSRTTTSVHCCLLTAVVALTQQCQADDEPLQVSKPPVHPSALLTVEATVLLPDGSPAADAVVHSYYISDFSKHTVTADRLGKVELQDHFLSDLRVHALSPDGQSQAVLLIPNAAVRSRISQPLTITLEPATPHQVVVTAKGQPVEGAHVAVSGDVSRQTEITQSDGTCVVWYPTGVKINSVVAWHPKYGVNGIRNRGSTGGSTKTELSMLSPGPHVIRILHSEGSPVAGRTITANVRMADGDWILAREIDATRGTSDANGEVRFDWFPAKGLKYVDVELLDKGWKEDQTDYDKIPNGMTTVHVRREFPVEGRVILPKGVNARGILVSGFGFGLGNTGDLPRARTRKDGTFSMHVPSGHGYVIGVSDLHWSSDIWSGVILPFEGEPQKKIVLEGYPATPAEFLVTRGVSREPIAKAWVHVSRRGQVEWTDETGESRSGSAGIGGWLLTDENGLVSTGIGLGNVEVRISADDWSEEKTIHVTSNDPVRVNFHRKWIGNRVLEARPVLDAVEYLPSSGAVALAWTERSPQVDKIHEPSITENGAVKVEFDENEVSLLLLDRKRHVSGFAKAGIDDVAVDLSMQPNATYSGMLVDRQDGRPLADRTVRMITESSFLDVVESQQTDRMGRFEFTGVAAGVPLRLSVKNEPGQPRYHLFGSERLFEPGEHRTGDVAQAALINGNVAVANKRVEQAVLERIANAATNSE